MSKAYTAEEVRDQFLHQIAAMASYWSRQDGDKLNSCNGLAFSILNILDGTLSLPAFDLVVRPHPDDKAFDQSQGEDYYEDGQVINDMMMHDIWHKYERPAQPKEA